MPNHPIVTQVPHVTKVKRLKLAAIGMVAASAVGGSVIGAMPEASAAPSATTPSTTAPSGAPTAGAVDPGALYNTAQQKFAAGDVPAGLDALKRVLAVAPADGDALALQAIWSDQADDAATSAAALKRLSTLNGALATSARNVISAVTDAAAIVPDVSSKQVSGRAAIVILGYGLNKNGTMAPELVNRVTAGRTQAQATTTLPIVVTGGVPKSGVTEASAMKTWLVSNGVDAARITPEDKSGSTVANAQNTAALLRPLGIANVVLVTSPSHIRRAAADFGATGLKVAATVVTQTDVAKFQTPLTRDQQKGIRLEATRAARIPATHQAGVQVPQLPQNLPDTGPGIVTEIGGKILEELLKAGSSALSGN